MRKLTKAEKAKRSKSIGVINGTYAKMKAARAKRSKSIGVLNGEMHKDVKSHNTTISVMSGTEKNRMLNAWKSVYGRLAADLISAKTIKEKNLIKKEMKIAKNVIHSLEKSK